MTYPNLQEIKLVGCLGFMAYQPLQSNAKSYLYVYIKYI